MLAELRWGFLRATMWLSHRLPCAATRRLCASSVSTSMRRMWLDL